MTIYTAIFGDYDLLKPPLRTTAGWRYLCYTDRPLRCQGWEVRQVPVLAGGPQRTARHYKINSHLHLPGQATIWVDGNFRVVGDLDELWKRSTSPVTALFHPFRKCLYQEALALLKGGRDRPRLILDQASRYLQAGVPERFGLVASGVLLRRPTEAVAAFNATWWEEVGKGSVRDQLGFGWAAWTHPGLYDTLPLDYRRNEFLKYLPHQKPRIRHA